ncbi:GldG family protein [Arenibaculum pallidiluteum]|uniref:GldG family protein n=1 Tax=Arenibaculum pallidiluteum TaxID=2812559 RepID=UPI001A958BDC|nr:Gldg family protein [Arenibaculum pallidiluteum]
MFERLERIERGWLAIGGLALAAVLFLAVNLAGSVLLRDTRLDLTERGLYTLSEGTRKTLATLEEPLRLRLYLSSALLREAPQLASYADRVRQMLETYAALSHDRIRLDVIDPRPFSPEEDRAVAFGLKGAPINAQGDRAFFGLAASNSTDDRQVIDFFSPERETFLEYDLTRLVHTLANPGKPVLSLIDGLGLAGGPSTGYQPWQVLEQMRQLFDVRTLGGDVAEIPRETAVLMVVHPQALGDKTLYAIDQHVMRGGRTMLVLDPYAEAQEGPRGMPLPDTASSLDRLLTAWGVRFTGDKVVADRSRAMQVQAVVGGRPVLAPYVAWLSLPEEALDRNDAVTGQLTTLTVASAGAFSLESGGGGGATLTPLAVTSPDAALIDAAKVRDNQDPAELLRDYRPEGKPLVLAARLTGTLSSAFTSGRPEGAPDGAPIARSEKPANLILVGDADLLSDRTWLSQRNVLGQRVAVPYANNGDFVVNALETLAGGDALVGLRGRGLSHRPFERVQAIEAEAERRYRATEQELTAKLKETEEKLANLARDGGAGDQTILTEEQQAAIESFRAEMLETRAQLRDVQHALRRDIEDLETRLAALNIGAVPAAVALAALAAALWRPWRSRAAVRTA